MPSSTPDPRMAGPTPGRLEGDGPLHGETVEPELVEAGLVEPPHAGETKMVLVTGALALALALAAAWKSLDLGIGSLPDPGPGLWPLIISIGMGLAAVALILGARHPAGTEPFSRDSIVVVVGGLSLLAYVYLFELVGFEIPTALLVLLWVKVIGREPWRISILVTVATTVVFYLLFVVGLSVSLPRLISF